MGEKRKYCVVVSILIIVLLAASALSSAGVFDNRNSAILELPDPKNMDKNGNQMDAIIASMNQQPSNSENVMEDDCGCGDGSVYIAPEGGLSSEDIAALQERGEKEGWTFTVGESSVTNRSLKALCGTIVDDEDQGGTPFDPEPINSLPQNFSWRNPNQNPTGRNCMTRIKDQGNCGSCWAFATDGALECIINRWEADVLDLSEQHLVSCNTDGWGCGGGEICPEYYITEEDSCGEIGAVLEKDFPYVASNADCDCPYPRTYEVKQHGGVSNSVNSIKQAIMKHGPVASVCYPNSAFQSYSGGVFNDCTNGQYGHAVVLVGWNDSQGSNGVWILRNSWGTGWGENGYMRIEYGCCDIGSGTEYINYSAGWEKKTKYGINYFFASGDVKPYGPHSIRMGKEPFGPDAQAWYKFNIGDDGINDNLHIGVYFCDWGWFGDGPSIYINNWSKTPQPSWDLLQHDLGKHDDYRWAWVGTFNANDQYVNRSDNNKIYVKVYAEANDDTVLDTIAIKYEYAQADIDCFDVNLDWDNVEPGDTVYGSFKVKNEGDPNSELSWEVNSSFIPSWGNWSFDPISGTGLKITDDPVTVDVEVTAPNQYGQTYSGQLRIDNTEIINFDMIDYNLTTREAIEDLSCSGSLSWTNVIPGSTVTGNFTVENIGDPTSELDWEVTDWPNWGTGWTFNPSSGTGLTPEDGPVTVQVSVTAPNQYGQTYTGNVKVVNQDDSTDYDLVPVTLTTREATPDLVCTGSLEWGLVEPGQTVTGNFTVENDGDPTSELDWEVTNWPNWGSSWTFTPSSGTGLTPEDDPVTVQVSAVAPNQVGTYSGNVKVVNQDDSTDYENIPASLEVKKPGPDLICSGELHWNDVEPGATLYGSFTVKNDGWPGSELDWEITEWPNWGTDWTFTPSSGTGLKPEDGAVTVQVSVVAPTQHGQTFNGKVKVVNKDDNSDYEEISAYVSTHNDAPNKPTITGETNGNAGTEYEYTFTTTDPESDNVFYWIKWGDGNEDGWLGDYPSGNEIKHKHTFSETGTYTIKAKAKDVLGKESEWGYLEVFMPVNQQSSQQIILQQSTNPLFLQILGRLIYRVPMIN